MGQPLQRETDRGRELISTRIKVKQSWADIKETVASLRECVVEQQWPVRGPIIVHGVHSAKHRTLPLTHTLTHSYAYT